MRSLENRADIPARSGAFIQLMEKFEYSNPFLHEDSNATLTTDYATYSTNDKWVQST
jgi:hypothetical protein